MIHLDGIPPLTTERLRLVAPAAHHAEAHIAFMTSDRARFNKGPVDRPTAWSGFSRVIGHWVMRGFGQFVIETRDGTAIGLTGPYFPEGDEYPCPELAYRLYDAGSEGKGIAFEAASAARGWYLEHFPGEPLASHVAIDNSRSRKLAKRLGGRYGATVTIEGWGEMHRYDHGEVVDAH